MFSADEEKNGKNSFIDNCKRQADLYHSFGSYKSSQYYTIQLATCNSATGVAYLARNLFSQQKYAEVISLIKNASAEDNLYCRYLLIRCKYELKDYEAVLNYSDDDVSDDSDPFAIISDSNSEIPSAAVRPTVSPSKIRSEIFVLRARALQYLGKKQNVADYYLKALKYTITNHDALDRLINCRLLKSSEYKEFLESLDSDRNVINTTTQELYRIELSPFMTDENINLKSPMLAFIPQLKFSLNVSIARATRHFHRYDYEKCYQITERAIYREMNNENLVTLHSIALVELNRSIELYSMASYLDEHNNGSFLAWFVIACYYYTIEHYQTARRCLKKALSLNSTSGSAWLLLGHMYAADNEHDLAMVSYIKSNDILVGAHTPTMYMGVECGRKKNLEIANKFMKSAITSGVSDPHLFHELAVIMHNLKKFNEAELYCLQAMNLVKNEDQAAYTYRWEPLFTNAGHISHQLKKYTDAYDYYNESLLLYPIKACTLSSIGLNNLMLNYVDDAEQIVSRALAMFTSPKMAAKVLTHIVEERSEDAPPIVSAFRKSTEFVNSIDPEHVNGRFTYINIRTVERSIINVSMLRKSVDRIKTGELKHISKRMDHKEILSDRNLQQLSANEIISYDGLDEYDSDDTMSNISDDDTISNNDESDSSI